MSKAAVDTLDKVSGEFEDEVLADLQEGRAQALALVESAKKEAQEEVAKILHAGSKQGESLKRQLIGAAELEVRNSQLKAMERAVNEAIEKALQRISEIPPTKHESSIRILIKEGIDVMGSQAVVACNSSDRPVVEAVVRKLNKGPVKLTVSREGLDSIGGVVLTTGGGSVRFDNTFEARLERMKPSLRKDVAALLGRTG